MVWFNDLLPQDDHSLRAVRMAVAVRERMAEHFDQARPGPVGDLVLKGDSRPVTAYSVIAVRALARPAVE